MLPWNYFSNTFSASASTFTANAGLFGKVYFPRLIVPAAVAVSNLFAFAMHFALTIACYVMFKVFGSTHVANLGWHLIIIPLVVIQVGALGIGAGLWMSALTTKYRDFGHISGFIISIWFYATPVIYPLSIVPNNMQLLAMLNPLTFSVEAFREILLHEGIIHPVVIGLSFGMTICIFVTGVLAFQKCERTFIDTI
jgi:lipopolysaccharide transport system permease protein